MVSRKILILFLILATTAMSIRSQDAYLNTQTGIYRLVGGPGSCDRVQISNGCGSTNLLLSIAVYKDTIYYTTWIGQLKRFKIGEPGSCETLLEYGAMFNSMTVDRNGILYMADYSLYRFDPRSKQLTNLGLMPFNSMGDLAFYKDKLLLAGYDPVDWSTGLYEIDVNDPSKSKLFMETPAFFGLLSYPVACGDNRYFGLLATGMGRTDLIELNLATKTIIGNTCSMPLDILDGASSTEIGMDDKVAITGLQINKTCLSTTSNVKVSAVYPQTGNLMYILDNSNTNNTGEFNNIAPGTHHVNVVASGGACSSDTSFTISPNYKIVDHIVKIDPDNCAKIPGSITIEASSQVGTVTFAMLNSGVTQNTGTFTNLHGGRYDFRITDAAGCSKDTSVALVENIPIGGCNDIFIPTAFTPNNDGRNDLYSINIPTSFRNINLQIFGRWGNIVCQAKGNNITWDGTFKGSPQPSGVYIYNLVFTDPNGDQRVLKGTITLIR